MLHWRPSLPSTQDTAHELAAAGAPHGTAVAAREQTRGRGRRGSLWISGEGGLWISVVLRPPVASVPECLSLRVGLEVARALEAALPELPLIRLKWPNDLYLGERKLGGILSEARWDGAALGWVVVGIGINVRNRLPKDLAALATRLVEYAPQAEVAPLAEPLAVAASRAGARPGALGDDELADFARRDWLSGRRLVQPQPGVAAGIDPDGALLVRRGARTARFQVGESVTLAEPAGRGVR